MYRLSRDGGKPWIKFFELFGKSERMLSFAVTVARVKDNFGEYFAERFESLGMVARNRDTDRVVGSFTSAGETRTFLFDNGAASDGSSFEKYAPARDDRGRWPVNPHTVPFLEPPPIPWPPQAAYVVAFETPGGGKEHRDLDELEVFVV